MIKKTIPQSKKQFSSGLTEKRHPMRSVRVSFSKNPIYTHRVSKTGLPRRLWLLAMTRKTASSRA